MLNPEPRRRQNTWSNAQRGWRPRQRNMSAPMYYSPGWASCDGHKALLYPDRDYQAQLHEALTLSRLRRGLRSYIMQHLSDDGWSRHILLPVREK